MNCFVFLSSNLNQYPCDKKKKNKHGNGKHSGEKNHSRSTVCQPELQGKEKVLYEGQCKQACLDR